MYLLVNTLTGIEDSEKAKKNNTVTANFLTKLPRYHFVRQGPQESFSSSFGHGM